jgi:hypothetical protein
MMAGSSTLREWRTSWTDLLQAGTWLVALIVLFVLKPPRLTPGDDGLIFVRAVGFVAAILLALCLVAVRRVDLRIRSLWFAAAVSLVAALIAFFGYEALIAAWTCEYDGHGPVVIGSTMLPDAQRYASGLSRATCEILIQDSGGDTASIWPRAELTMHHLSLAGTFMATVLLFALAAMLAVETFRAGMTRPQNREPS